MPALQLDVESRTLRLAEPFRISGYVFETWDVVEVRVTDGTYHGRGEGGGAYFLGDDVPHMLADIEGARALIEKGAERSDLLDAVPAGGGRNAIDCALWELEAARSGRNAWQIAGLSSPKPVRTTFTLGANSPEEMAKRAKEYVQAKSIKIKLTGEIELDLARVAAIRAARPDVWLGVDGNQGFGIDDLPDLVRGLRRLDVSLLEQPLPRGAEAMLEGFHSDIPIAGDESILTLADVETAVGRFDVINIKLDKCGGLTEGLLMAERAKELGLGIMVGCMVGTSLAMAPAFLLGQLCDLVDLDGPTFLSADPEPAARYQDGMIWAGQEIWGSASTLAA